MNELGKRAIACKHWRWMPGMLDAKSGLRVTKASSEDDPRIGFGNLNEFLLLHPHMMQGQYPDLADPATLGCLLVLVRESWGGCGGTHLTAVGWRYYTPNGHLCSEGATEAEALVAALEAAE